MVVFEASSNISPISVPNSIGILVVALVNNERTTQNSVILEVFALLKSFIFPTTSL